MWGPLLTFFLAFGGVEAKTLVTSEAPPKKNPRTLVVLNDLTDKQTYSTFLKAIKARGHTLEFKMANQKLKLMSFGVSNYDNLLMLVPEASGKGKRKEQILKFVDAGNNVLITLNSNMADTYKNLAKDVGIDLNKRKKVYDHFGYNLAAGREGRSTTTTSNWCKYSPVMGDAPKAPVVFNGVAVKLRENNDFGVSILNGNAYSYTIHNKKGTMDAIGSDVQLVAAFQSRKNGRITFAGSTVMFTDRYFSMPVNTAKGKHYKKSGNEAFCRQVAIWTFKERGFLKVEERKHFKTGQATRVQTMPTTNLSPPQYREGDYMEYHMEMKEFREGEWRPFTNKDVQFEFVRLDPFIRQTFETDGKGHYAAVMRVPDTFGLYKFKVNYFRKGYSMFKFEEQIDARPFRHNEYPRFLLCAAPYYISTISLMVSLLVFSVFFLYGKQGPSKGQA